MFRGGVRFGGLRRVLLISPFRWRHPRYTYNVKIRGQDCPRHTNCLSERTREDFRFRRRTSVAKARCLLVANGAAEDAPFQILKSVSFVNQCLIKNA